MKMLSLKKLCKIVTLLFIFVLFFLSITINRNTTKNTHSRIQVDFLRLNDTTPNKLTHGFSANFQDNAMNFSTTKEQFRSLQNIYPGLPWVNSGQDKKNLDEIISAIDCENSNSGSREKTIVLVPYRDRAYNLKLFISPLHKHLMDQELDYSIYIIEQNGNLEEPFNRAKLFNVGVIEGIFQHEIQNNHPIDGQEKMCYCLILHDIDTLPENPETPYSCYEEPTQLSVQTQKLNYEHPYKENFGGVVSIKLKQFLSINGMSNRFWGWGAEDDDMRARLITRGLKPKYLSGKIGRFKSLQHKNHSVSSKQFLEKYWKVNSRTIDEDGLIQTKYKHIDTVKTELFTKITIDLLYEEQLN